MLRKIETSTRKLRKHSQETANMLGTNLPITYLKIFWLCIIFSFAGYGMGGTEGGKSAPPHSIGHFDHVSQSVRATAALPPCGSPRFSGDSPGGNKTFSG